MAADLEDIKLIEDQIAGLEASITEARKNKEAFIEAIGVSSQIEKESVNLQEYVETEAELKKKIADLKTQRSSAVATMAKTIKTKLSEVLPYGEGYFSVSPEGQVSIGWKMEDGTSHPMESLSGGERVMFFSALANVFGANIIIQEAAEMDEYHLLAALGSMAQLEQQVIVNTWYPVSEGELPLAWKVVHLEGAKENDTDNAGRPTESGS